MSTKPSASLRFDQTNVLSSEEDFDLKAGFKLVSIW